MNNIKFRAWVKEEEKMVKVAAIAFEKNSFDTKSYVLGTAPHLYDIDNNCYTLEDCILLQYTGLQDYEGEDIYDRDIVEIQNTAETKTPYVSIVNLTPYGVLVDGHPLHVKAGIGGSRLLIDYIDYGEVNQYYKKCNKLGNIFENPELLKEGKFV